MDTAEWLADRNGSVCETLEEKEEDEGERETEVCDEGDFAKVRGEIDGTDWMVTGNGVFSETLDCDTIDNAGCSISKEHVAAAGTGVEGCGAEDVVDARGGTSVSDKELRNVSTASAV
jgi:hypothetical protein